MSQLPQPVTVPPDADPEFLQRIAEARALLTGAASKLKEIAEHELFATETPIEVTTTMEIVAETISKAIQLLKFPVREKPPISPDRPTHQQGQFLAFISEYTMRNRAGLAPSHADFQQFFNLTPPSVNSMLIRLERRGFIRRTPHTARAIELTINPDLIPPLDRPFKF
jgi:repressor LexA